MPTPTGTAMAQRIKHPEDYPFGPEVIARTKDDGTEPDLYKSQYGWGFNFCPNCGGRHIYPNKEFPGIEEAPIRFCNDCEGGHCVTSWLHGHWQAQEPTKTLHEVKTHLDKIEIGTFPGSGQCELVLAGIKVKIDDMLKENERNQI